jgi:hypothetical protein
MTKQLSFLEHPKMPGIVFLLSIFVSFFWIMLAFVDVYRYAGVGAFFEILWLPAVFLTIVLPALSLFLWFREKFNPRSLYLVSLVLIVVTFVLLGIYKY